MGHERLYNIIKEKDAIYAKPDFSDADGIRTAELEHEFADMNGWDAEPEAARLLSDLGIPDQLHQVPMKQLEASEKVRVLLAQALLPERVRVPAAMLRLPVPEMLLESVEAAATL